MRQLWLAACGCWHKAWDSSFYPDDLPSSWRFSYYSNEFSAIYLTCQEWAGASLEQLQAWIDDCDEDFQFLLQVDLQEMDHGLLSDDAVWEKLALLRPQLGALLFCGSEDLLAAHAARFCQAAPEAQYFANNSTRPEFHSWQELRQGDEEIRANLLIITRPVDSKILARCLKPIVDSNRSGGLIFCGDPPQLENLRQAEGLLPFFLSSDG